MTVATQEFGDLVDRPMENVFSQLVASNDVTRIPRHRAGRRPQTFQRTTDDFQRLLVDLLREAIVGQRCEYHASIVRLLQPGDTVISFNYDCIIDQALADVLARSGLFDSRRSYGYPVTAGAQFWGLTPKRPRANPVLLLKPHGSLNWNISGGASSTETLLTLRENPYTGTSKDRIIPPLASKRIDSEPFQSVWGACRDALEATRALVVIGYSAPDVDALSQALIRLHLGAGVRLGLSSLIIADPSSGVRAKIRSLGARVVKPERTRIIEVQSLQELAGWLTQ